MSENSYCDPDDVSDYGDEIPPEIVANQGKREFLFGFYFNCIRCVTIITIDLIQTTYFLFKRNSLFVIIYVDSYYAFLLKTKTLFPYFVELRGTRFKK